MKYLRLLAFVCSTVVLVVVVLPATTGTEQINTRTEYPVDWYITPVDAPCLVETIHVTGSFEERVHAVIDPLKGYSWQVHQNTMDMTAVGLTTGQTYRFSGPLSYVENGYIDPCDCWYPVEWTFHNINHFEGPGQLPNVYFRTLTHITYDRATGQTKVEISKDDVLCKAH